MIGDITRKKLNQWQTWDQQVQYKISEFNIYEELQLDCLLTSLQNLSKKTDRWRFKKTY